MGANSKKFFEEADRLGGIAAKARLASLARVTSTQAVAGVDDDVTVERLGSALEVLRDEYRRRGAVPAGQSRPDSPARPSLRDAADTGRLRGYLDCIVELVSQRNLTLGDPASAARHVNEAAATRLGVARVSIWLLEDEGAVIRCFDLYEAAIGGHSTGTMLHERDYAVYFAALDTERTIAAHDALTDERTCCFAESYLRPLGITSMLDVPIWVGGGMIGVICHEHVGVARRWTEDEERFAYLMSGFVALAFERAAAEHTAA